MKNTYKDAGYTYTINRLQETAEHSEILEMHMEKLIRSRRVLKDN